MTSNGRQWTCSGKCDGKRGRPSHSPDDVHEVSSATYYSIFGSFSMDHLQSYWKPSVESVLVKLYILYFTPSYNKEGSGGIYWTVVLWGVGFTFLPKKHSSGCFLRNNHIFMWHVVLVFGFVASCDLTFITHRRSDLSQWITFSPIDSLQLTVYLFNPYLSCF